MTFIDIERGSLNTIDMQQPETYEYSHRQEDPADRSAVFSQHPNINTAMLEPRTPKLASKLAVICTPPRAELMQSDC